MIVRSKDLEVALSTRHKDEDLIVIGYVPDFNLWRYLVEKIPISPMKLKILRKEFAPYQHLIAR